MYTSVLIHSWLVCTDGEVKSPESSVFQGQGSRCSFLDFNPNHNPKFSLSLVQLMEGLRHSRAMLETEFWRLFLYDVLPEQRPLAANSV